MKGSGSRDEFSQIVEEKEHQGSEPSNLDDLQGKQPFDHGPWTDEGERRAIFNVLDSYR